MAAVEDIVTEINGEMSTKHMAGDCTLWEKLIMVITYNFFTI